MQPAVAPPLVATSEPKPLSELVTLLRGRRILALTGAGCSTESGIPDYRGPETRHKPRNPIQGPDFARSAEVRRRYWARAVVGFDRFRAARPNPAHHALARLEREGTLSAILTQNVDGLHRAAGSRRVVELHGALDEAFCLACGEIEPRAALQARLLERNPGFLSFAAEAAPDGDADLPAEAVDRFAVAPCRSCEGPLKPRVVFFGDNVPRPVVDEAFALVDAAEALLVVGTSLTVFSGYRFLLRARDRGIPVGVVNIGPVRGEALCAVRVEALAGEALPALAEALAAPAAGAELGAYG